MKEQVDRTLRRVRESGRTPVLLKLRRGEQELLKQEIGWHREGWLMEYLGVTVDLTGLAPHVLTDRGESVSIEESP